MPQPLPGKERTLFTQVVKNFENKQYKKGLKAAEQILRKHANHGDTQAMKALILNSQGHQEEAFALAKVALKNDMKSHVCWHVYGLLYRSVKNFEESIKAYKFALKIEPESVQIQRDLALLQIQMRDYKGYVQSRRAMLQARPGLRSNWTALAIAQHLSGDLIDAERTLVAYEETLRQQPLSDVEHQEAAFYKNTVIAEMGEIERALEHLDAISKHTFDKQGAMEMKAQYLLDLGQNQEAEKVYRALLDRNAENRAYYNGLEKAIGIEKQDVKKLNELYMSYAEKNPKADAPRRIPLDFLEGEDFSSAADQYLKRMLKRGVPSTFANLKALYSKTSKMDIIQGLVEGYAKDGILDEPNGVTDDKSKNDPSTFELSTLYFLAQHYDYFVSRNLEKAMSAIEKAIEKTPKSVDYHMTKARILKHYGNIQQASEIMDKARSLDERDRYINTKAAKYQLRNNENQKAVDNLGKFTRAEAIGGPVGDLIDMQCMWFLWEDGESYLRQNNLGFALKRFTSIYNIFEVWQEDQFDFHSFSLRKGQIRAYVDMVRWEDHLRNHPFYTRAAVSAIRAYILLYDRPQLAHGDLSNGVNGARTDAGERKKAARKARKAQEKQEQLEAEKKDAKKTAGVGADGETKKEDKDPEGKLLVQTTEPLKDATKFLTPMLEFSPKCLEGQEIGFEVFLRRNKYLLALRCLLATHSLAPTTPAVHGQAVRLQHAVSIASDPIDENVSSILSSKLKPHLPSSSLDLKTFNEDFVSKNKDAASLLTGLKVRQFIDGNSTKQNTQALVDLVGREQTSVSEAIEGLRLLVGWGAESTQYTEEARKRWPEIPAFRVKA